METVTSRTNERVKRLAELCESAKARRESGVCAAHGLKLCAEASARAGLVELWATGAALEKREEELKSVFPLSRVTVMSESVCDKLSPQKCPDGVIGVAQIPGAAELEEIFKASRVLVLCDVQDPANAGAAARTAAAFGYGAVALTAGCADMFSPKALRASMGAAFAVKRALIGGAADFAKALNEHGFFTVATALDKDALAVDRIGKREKLALFIGNEGNGLPGEVIAACASAAYIPITGDVESLNAAAAAAVAMWETRP